MFRPIFSGRANSGRLNTATMPGVKNRRPHAVPARSWQARAPPVALDPRGLGNPGVADALVVLPFDIDGDRQPLRALGRLDQIAVPPVASGVLHVVVEDELIDL